MNLFRDYIGILYFVRVYVGIFRAYTLQRLSFHAQFAFALALESTLQSLDDDTDDDADAVAWALG